MTPKVLCTASVSDKVPRFLKGKNQGWLTAEYSMLPRATNTRNDREASRGKQGGRTLEIQRLIGRCIYEHAMDMKKLGEHTIHIDCDVIQADGGTRTASITGACIALKDAIDWMLNRGKIKNNPFKQYIGAVSVGLYRGQAVLDLDYAEDVIAETDMNVVMTESGEFIELQGTAEEGSFNQTQLLSFIDLAGQGIKELNRKAKDSSLLDRGI